VYHHYGLKDSYGLGAPLFDGCGILDSDGEPKLLYLFTKEIMDTLGDTYVANRELVEFEGTEADRYTMATSTGIHSIVTIPRGSAGETVIDIQPVNVPPFNK